MKILALDTTGKQAGAAIVDEYITIGEIMINAQSGPKAWHHSEILMPAVERLLALSGHNLEDMDYVAYTAGPGSFTGIRIGAATALGLAHSIGKPAVAVPTLDSLAYNVLGAVSQETLIVPLMDARSGQVYASIYRAVPDMLTQLADSFISPIMEALERVGEYDAPVIFLGDGADAYKTEIAASYPKAKIAPANANRQRAASVGLCAIHQLKAHGHFPHNEANPGQAQPRGHIYLDSTANPTAQPQLIYIREPQAVRNRQP